jgi:hypothetical protein
MYMLCIYVSVPSVQRVIESLEGYCRMYNNE